MTYKKIPKQIRKPVIFKSILIFAGVFLSLGGTELIIRMNYMRPWNESLIDEKAESRHPILKNRYGLRKDTDYSDEKQPKHLRILILGDSFTFGSGVHNNKAIFPKLLEKRLNENIRLYYFAKAEILNGGIPGSLTHKWLSLFERIKNSFKPDVVLIVFFLRDGTLTTSMGGFFMPIRNRIVKKNRESYLYQHFYIYRICKDKLDRIMISKIYTLALKRSYFGNKKQTSEWRNAQHNILEITEQAKRIQASSGLVVFPILIDLDDSYPFEDICNEIVRFAKKNNIPACNLLDAFRNMKGEDLWVGTYDQHPNEKAHKIASKAIYPFLKKIIPQKYRLE